MLDSDQHCLCIAEAAGEDREALAAWRFIHSPSMDEVLSACGIVPIVHQFIHPWWALLRVLTPSPDGKPTGDIDIVAGRLVFDENMNGLPELEEYQRTISNSDVCPLPGHCFGLDLMRLAAFEVKCAFIEPHVEQDQRLTGGLKGGKAKAQNQRPLVQRLTRLQEMGFDNVALIDLIGGIPSKDGSLGMIQGSVSDRAVEREHLRGADWSPPAEIGHFMATFAGILGHNEMNAAYASMRVMKLPEGNPRSRDHTITENRRQLNHYLRQVIAECGNEFQFWLGPMRSDRCPECKRWGPHHLRADCRRGSLNHNRSQNNSSSSISS